MIRLQIQIFLLTFQVANGFRTLYDIYDKSGYLITCHGLTHSHAPGMHPHPCVAYNPICESVTEPKMVIADGQEILCHPRLRFYSIWTIPYYEEMVFCYYQAILYDYSESTDLVLSCKEIPNTQGECFLAQKAGDIIKCQYCSTVRFGEFCNLSIDCGNNCASCTSNYCGTCKEGFSPSDNADLKCTLACQTGHKQCSNTNGVYAFEECKQGYEKVDNQCVACPNKCTTCVMGICSACEFHYHLKDNQCFGELNCTKVAYILDPNTGLAVGMTCEICDFGYFYNSSQQKCTRCKDEPGLENCLICMNPTECKICKGTHVITADKKCIPFIGCSSKCQTCLYTDPDYCTTCYLKERFESSAIVPGKCVCDYPNGYIEKDGQCAKCLDGQCQTCGQDYYDCTSCKPISNRMLVGSQCICKQGYFETGHADQICLKCYVNCFNCKGISENDCTECGDPNIYSKYFDNGKCFCFQRTLLQTQSDGNSICKPCHPLCEKCYQPSDNTTNQYCTMCIEGQHRVVSNDFRCACQDGYGESGTSDICIKCHYSCLSCKGPLQTDCIACSTVAHRHLTVDYKCACDQAYYDPGFKDQLCYLACHHSCASCNVYGQDKCTSCPSTRHPDKVGTNFQCLCNDSNYYSDPVFLECQQCHPSCKTCNGASQTNCLSCDTTYRQLNISKCDCYPGYYSTGILQCSQCHYTCLTCYSASEDGCITCSVAKNRLMKANKCVCMDNTMEASNTDAMCSKCSYRCSSCTIKVDNCTKCPDQSFRDLGTDNSCSCPAYYYDEPGKPICIKCYSNCYACKGPKYNQCTACNLFSKRELSANGECVCMSKYYDTGKQECSTCSTDCLDCINTPTNCISCNPDKYLLGNICQCKTKLQGTQLSTYFVPSKNKCQSCHYSCLSCSGSLSNQCLSCLNSESRILVGTSCICIENYLDSGFPNCTKCDGRCSGCVTLPTLCKSCPISSLRIYNSVSQSCNCPDTYYDDEINPICQKCDYTCQTCKIISTRCESCQINSYRTYDSILFSCNCDAHYYDSGVPICQQCHYTCQLCNDYGSNQCITCQPQATSFRILNGKVCECLLGYYDDGYSLNCQQCYYTCLSCINSSTYCTSCEQTRHLDQNQCLCNTGYFEKGLSNCSKCDSNCYNCNLNSKKCTECDKNSLRLLNTNTNTCQCQSGTTEIDGLCQQCNVNCQECLNTITNCTSCVSQKILVNSQCICIDGTYLSNLDNKCYSCNSTCATCVGLDSFCLTCASDKNRIINVTNHTCNCKAGYYEDTVKISCIQCDQTCLTCFATSSYCTQCDQSLNLTLNQQNRCVCKSSYFFNIISQQCELCNFTCTECLTQTQCLTCELITRYLDNETSKCLCKDGFYEANQKQCLQCHSSCKTCQMQSNQCLTCEESNKRLFQMNRCPCLDGYYDVGIEMCQKCNDICQTCQTSSTRCHSCYENHLRVLNQNSCTCIPGYFDNGKLICQKCSNSCQTCKNQRDYCTSCDINQGRLDQSIIHKCPCISNFYEDSNETCQKCHIKCSGCVNDKNNCVSCKYVQGSNRLTISNQCNCKDGYYDDEVQVICKKCNTRCKICENDPNNCLKCLSNLRIDPPVCHCMNGYFETDQLLCEPCEIQCDTCQTLASNCVTCKQGRLNKTCDCEDGYFEGGQPECIICDFQCQTCAYYADNCLACKGDRFEIPFCRCQDGYYDDFQTLNCLKCDYTCKTCTLDECLSCNGNRILSDQMTCDPPPNSISSLLTPWCSNCEVAVMKIKLSDDLTTIIVHFDFPLNPNFFSNYLESNGCFNVLNQTTLSKLGMNPQCNIDPANDKQLLLNIGENPTIIPGDTIDFLENSFGHTHCDSKLQHFIFNQLLPPSNPFAPAIQYDVPTYQLNPCEENIILIESKLYDGLRSFISIQWSFIVQGSNGNGDLENFVTELTNYQILDLTIPEKTFPIQSNITLFVEVQNFVSEKNVSKIEIQTHAGQFPSILQQLKQYYYPFESIKMIFTMTKKSCIDNSNISQDNSQYQIQFYEIYRNNSLSRSSNLNFNELISSNLLELNIESYSLSAFTAYIFKFTISDSSVQYESQRNITLQIKSGGILCVFNGTKKIQNYQNVTNIHILCKDLDVLNDWNQDPNLSIMVSCLELTSREECKDSQKQKLIYNSTQTSQTFPKATIEPYTIQSWQVIATKNSVSYSYNTNILYLDYDFQILDVDYNSGYLIRPVNNYEDLQFTFNIPFQERQYLVDYQIALIYDYQLITILKSQYFQYSFQLYDYLQQFNKGNKFLLKLLAQFTDDIIPNQIDLTLFLNQPPICNLKMLQQNIQTLESQKLVINCELSDDKPYSYQMKVFLFKDDFEEFNNKTSDNSLLYYSFQQSNHFILYLPSSEINIIFQIMDFRGSFTNIHQNFKISKKQILCNNQKTDQLNLRQKIAWIFEIMINHNNESDCIKLKDELYNSVEQVMSSEAIYEKLLAYQTLNLYKKLEVNQKAQNSSMRLLEQDQQNECYNKESSLFSSTDDQSTDKKSANISSIIASSQQVEVQIADLIYLKRDIEQENKKNDLIIDTQQVMKFNGVIQMLFSSVQLIDNQLLIIQENQIQTQYQEQVMNISETLIQLIDKITLQIIDKVKVNGQVLQIQGLMMKLQLQKITKSVYNKEFQLEDDYLDNLIAFQQKKQIKVNYNYYNLSNDQRSMLQIYLNRSDFEINQKYFVKSTLTNFLYANTSFNQPQQNTQYRIDLAEFQYCDTQKGDSEFMNYNYYCINHLEDNTYENCDLLMEELNNKSAQLYCKCKSFGSLFLIKISNKSINQQNNTLVNQIQEDYQNIEIFQQTFIYVQIAFIISSIMVYCALVYLDYQSQKNIIMEQASSNSSDTLELAKKAFQINIYPGHIFMFKTSFYNIHSILQFFQNDQNPVKKSFRFLQVSNQISILILTSTWEVLLIDMVIINACINLLITLVIRALSKITQAIYMFEGKASVVMVVLYLCLPFMYIFLMILALNQIEINKTEMDIQITLNLLSTLLLVFFIYEPIAIYIRIVIYRPFLDSINRNEQNPVSHFVYFFIYHSKINKIYNELNIR
ncbi:unnamed protein product [Paramecium octaurelia]|uniref:EGF-like domain-containing protein n=1 Tax=Paramecium octaurelia TaxID=43137 RepID=A0A8S1UFG7_PAROT|nr:unnamed protein product [Paramecium octaurelia]